MEILKFQGLHLYVLGRLCLIHRSTLYRKCYEKWVKIANNSFFSLSSQPLLRSATNKE